jgi:hypothetical protein
LSEVEEQPMADIAAAQPIPLRFNGRQRQNGIATERIGCPKP